MKIKSIIGYIWTMLALAIAPAIFFGQRYFSQILVGTTGITINPWYSGGEIVKVIDHAGYKTSVHRPVFDSLIGYKKEGFVQINWDPAAGLPSVIREGVDYNGDSRVDFTVVLNTGTGEVALVREDPDVLSIERSYRLKNGWAVRVLLTRRD